MSDDKLTGSVGARSDGPQSREGRARKGSGEVDAPAVSPSRPVSPSTRGHPKDCRCVRCVGFTPGPNGSAITRLTHGARSNVEIQPRAQEVAEGIAAALREESLWRESFRPTVDACAIVLVRLERANAALTQMDEVTEQPLTAYLDREGDPFAKLRQDAARWANVARGYLNDLGLTPRSLAAIARDTGLARSTRASSALTALAEHVEQEHAA